MNLDELKKSMSTLDDVLAQKGNEPIMLNTGKCNAAQGRIAKQYRKSTRMCAVLAIVFITMWLAGINDTSFPSVLKGFLGIYMALAAVWFSFLYFKTKKINVATDTPIRIMGQVASLRLYALTGEIILGVILAVFFTIFLSNLWVVGQYKFWIVCGALLICLLIGAVLLPGKIRDFRNLTSVD